MKIKYNFPKNKLFGDINIGEVFEYSCEIYVKVDPINSYEYQALSLNTYKFANFNDETLVIPKKSTLVIED